MNLGSNDYREVLHVSQSFKAETSPSESLELYPGYFVGGESVALDHLLRYSYPSAEMQSVYSAVPVDWAIRWG